MGSERPCSMPAICSFFITSNSLAGRVGSRRIWRRISRTAGRLARLVSTVNVTAPSAEAAESSQHPHAHAGAEPGEVLVERVLDLLAGQVLGASGHQLGQEAGRLGQALEVLGVAVVEGQPQLDGLAAGLLGQEGQLDAGDRLGPLHPGLDGQRRDVEGLARLGLDLRGRCSRRPAWRCRAPPGSGSARAWLVGTKKPTVRLLVVKYFSATSLTCAGVTCSMRSRLRK